MFKFFSLAFKELSHVVWPTKKETRTYMYYTLTVIIVMTIFLAIVGYGFSTGLRQAKKAINPVQNPAQQYPVQNSAQQYNVQTFLNNASVTTETKENSENTTTENTTNSENTPQENSEIPALPSETSETSAESTN